MTTPGLSCLEEIRREDVRSKSLHGLDYAEVSDDQLTLTVVFLGKAPAKIEKENVRITGGRRIRDIQVTSLHIHRDADPARDDSIDVTVNKPGDFSSYTLSVVQLDEQGRPTAEPMEGFDPRYYEVGFTFKAGCPSDLDCKAQPVCPPPQRAHPEINYLAKDYRSFRQLILDRLALTMPDWHETHAPDLGIALVELLAYAGDYLSYYQDAVGTEAYLGTSRQRISVRRHARLVDYVLHEGCNSRAWVTIETDQDDLLLGKPQDFYFVTSFAGAPDKRALQPADLATVPRGSYEVFEPLTEDRAQEMHIYKSLNEIHFYTWGDCRCCLAQGATAATLKDRWVPGPGPIPRSCAPKAAPPCPEPPQTVRALNLCVGDVLVFEEVIGPKTGNPADADPKHRQAVRLTKVTRACDPLYHQEGYPDFDQPIVEIEWCSEDALTFALCISSQAPPPDCTCLENVSVARGNVILVDNGQTTGEPFGTVPSQSTAEYCTACGPAETVTLPGEFRPVLKSAPLTFSEPLPPCGCASAFIRQDPRQALPQISLTSIPPAPSCPDVKPSPCQIPCQLPPLFTFADLADPAAFARRLKSATDLATQFLNGLLSHETRRLLAGWDGTGSPPAGLPENLVKDLTALLETWLPKSDLLENGPDDTDFVVEIDNDGYAHLRFGDGNLGRMPDAGTAFRATYRVGNGPAGNVGAETIAYIVFRQPTDPGNPRPRNPLPATGGSSPETIAEAKLFAPHAFRNVLERAITGDDYAALAQDNARRLKERPVLLATQASADAEPAPSSTGDDPRATVEEEPGKASLLVPDICRAPFRGLQGAKGALRWTGSWYEALVAIDPLGTEETGTELLAEITAYLEPYRRIGHDLEVKPAQYVPLDLVLTVCVLPQYLRGHVEAALADVFSNRVLPDGQLGFFHPDKLTFGEGIYVSRIVAAAQAVAGVQNVQVTRLESLEIGEPAPGAEAAKEEVPPRGVLPLGPFEIARLDNDPSFPENGRLTLDMRGGR
jgi:hypothetical protein